MKSFIIALFLFFTVNTAFAQIGYQVSLLNSATGQPRAGETVTVDIKLTNCENTEVYTTQQKAASNDFGVLSLSVGDAQTFEELNWNKLPLYIEVSIDGVLIAKSQVLSVPVAEYAKKSGFVVTEKYLASKSWKYEYVYSDEADGYYTHTKTIVFKTDGTFSIISNGQNVNDSWTIMGKYTLINNIIYTVYQDGNHKYAMVLHYVPIDDYVICGDDIYY